MNSAVAPSEHHPDVPSPPAAPERVVNTTYHQDADVSQPQPQHQDSHSAIELQHFPRPQHDILSTLSSSSGDHPPSLKIPPHEDQDREPTPSTPTTSTSSVSILFSTNDKKDPTTITLQEIEIPPPTPERRDSISPILPPNTNPPPNPPSDDNDNGLESAGIPPDVLPTLTQPCMNRFRFLSLCLLSIGNGMNDSAPGALIPSIEKQYNLGYALVSLIFVGASLGCILAAPLIDSIRERLGRAQSLALTQLLLAAGLIPLACTAPFPAIIISFFLIGFTGSFNLAIGNVFCGSLRNGTTALGIMHGMYGIGGTIGPLIATGLMTIYGTVWSRFYFITLGLAGFNCCFTAWSWWGYEAELEKIAVAAGLEEGDGEVVDGQLPTVAAVKPSPAASGNFQGMLTAASSRVVLLGALFIFAYQGAEVSISGWIISFLLDTRGGDRDKVGYVTAGFWGGITLGRFLLSAPAHWIGEKKFVYGAVIGAAGFQLVVWLVPNVTANAVAVVMVGLLLGPVYPCGAAVFMRGMSKHEQVSGIGVISAFGSAGGAAAPFTTGLLAQAVGTFLLHPIAIGLFGVMMLCWYGQPGSKPKITGR